jgi:DNA-binding CsgD family transcriptional regulator
VAKSREHRARSAGVVAGRRTWTFAERPPPGLEVSYVEIDGETFAVFSFPIALADDFGLTASEREVVTGVLRGLNNTELAKLRGVSPRTIANQLAAIYRKLSVSSRTELVELLLRR